MSPLQARLGSILDCLIAGLGFEMAFWPRVRLDICLVLWLLSLNTRLTDSSYRVMIPIGVVWF